MKIVPNYELKSFNLRSRQQLQTNPSFGLSTKAKVKAKVVPSSKLTDEKPLITYDDKGGMIEKSLNDAILKILKAQTFGNNPRTLSYELHDRKMQKKSLEEWPPYKKPPKKWLIHTEDLLLPKDIKKLQLWDDYVLLYHDSYKSSIIKKEGLKCRADIDSSKIDWYGNDPNLIYFRPITPNGIYKAEKDSIVIAVPKCKVIVFNQEERVHRDFEHYCRCSMPVEKYDELMSNLKHDQYLNEYMQIRSLSDYSGDRYIPEVCFADRYIPPKYFYKDVEYKFA